MSNKVHLNVLMIAGIVSSLISAIFMASTLYSLAPAGWMAGLAVIMGLILEAFKSGFSRLSADFYAAGRYAGFAVSAIAVLVALAFAVWAGQERFMHALEADQRESVALHQVRLQQIQDALAANAKELQQLDTATDPEAAALAARIADLYSQSKTMREKMGWTKAEQLEASIKPLREEFEHKQQLATERRSQRAAEIRNQNSALLAEQVAINSRTGKVVTTDLATAGLILKAVIVLLETAPIFLFFVSGLKRTGFNPGSNPQQNRVLEGDERDSILEKLRVAAGSKVTSIIGQDQSPAMAFSESSAGSPENAGITHPKVPDAIEYLVKLEPGTKIATLEFKAAMAVGSDSVAKILSQISSDSGLVQKVGRSWVRV
ncbi:hypothetical protein ACSQ5K_26530 [Pseudomonas sp. PhalM4]